MKKNIDMKKMQGSMPFRVPDGYFEGLPSRIMSHIDEAWNVSTSSANHPVSKGKIVTLGGHRWIGIAVAIAACFVGVFVLFSLIRNGNNAQQTMPQIASVQHDDTSKAIEATPSEESIIAYANEGAVTKAEETTEEETASTETYTPKSIRTTQETNTTPKTSKNHRHVNYTVSEDLLASNQVKTKAVDPSYSASMVPTSVQTSESNDLESELIDYALMDDMEIYDYLAGVEYY